MLVLFDGDLGARDTFRFVEEKLGIGILSRDLVSARWDWSFGVYKLLGLDPGVVKPSFELLQSRLHPEDRFPKEAMAQLLDQGVPIVRDYRVILEDRTVRWVRARSQAMYDAGGSLTRIAGILQDVTDQYVEIQQLKAYKAEKGRFDALVSAAHALKAIIWTARAGGSITELRNRPKTREDCPYSVFDDGWLDYVHAEDRQEALERWSAALKTGQSFCADYRVLQPDDEYRWIRSGAAPVFNQDREAQAWVGISIEVQEMKLSASSSSPMLTGSQTRGARGILNWSIKNLADRTGISAAVIRRLEESDGAPTAPDDLLELIQKTFSDAGIEFLFPTSGKPGLRLR